MYPESVRGWYRFRKSRRLRSIRDIAARGRAPHFGIDSSGTADILASVSAQVAGILLGVFSVVVSVVIFWGAYAEQNRSNRDAEVSRH